MVLFLKKTLTGICHFMFRVLPKSVVKSIIKLMPKTALVAPPGIEINIDNYLTKYKLHLSTTSCVERIMIRGTYEPYNLKILNLYIEPGDVCIDVGANVGAISLAIADRVTAIGRVYSFEPHPRYFKKFVSHVLINNLSDVIKPQNLGVSSSNGTLYLEEDHREDGIGNAGISDASSKQSFPVEVVTIDNFVKNNNVQKVNFLKIDVEGHEADVFLGGVNTISRFHPYILFETIITDDTSEIKLVKIQNILSETGYKAYGVYPGSAQLLKPIKKLGESSMTFAIPNERQLKDE